MKRHPGLVTCLALIALSCTAWAAEPVTVAVMEFSSKGGVTQKQMDALGDLLANEIRSMSNYRVIGKSDIGTALDMEQRKAMVGCSDDSCIAEVGGALGVRWVTIGNISKFGESFLLNIKILDATKVMVIAGVSKKIEGGEGQLIDALSAAAKELFAKAGPIMAGVQPQKMPPEKQPVKQPDKTAATTPPTPPRQTAATTPPPKIEAAAPSDWLNTWGHVAFWSGAGLTALGTIALVIGLQKGDDYANVDLSEHERLDALDKSRAWSAAMWVGYGTGFALMATGATFWIIDSLSGPEGTTAALVPTADGRGMVFGLGGRW